MLFQSRVDNLFVLCFSAIYIIYTQSLTKYNFFLLSQRSILNFVLTRESRKSVRLDKRSKLLNLKFSQRLDFSQKLFFSRNVTFKGEKVILIYEGQSKIIRTLCHSSLLSLSWTQFFQQKWAYVSRDHYQLIYLFD